ncbi:acyltransferase domain-containing protein [Starkeya sp. 3C]|uniref:Malonyl CoA-acyl carrier protein transacylase n=1 Tax=Ancylobacter moscoviensis TaxID=2597768 RepID=A0ABY3DLW9_9HYPH|nr:acyltransferase domain-containing protein [Ancylobacter moscoviensis]TSJ60248.1 acyltransferase domain-containing protein [Ancylobacter moscoviensis]
MSTASTPRTALLFPGQGSQSVGMLAALPPHPAIAATLDEASGRLGHDWRELDTAEALAGTRAAQLALLIAGVATARALAAEAVAVDAVLGHSVGAFPAAVAAGVLDFADALRLVALRGERMARLFPAGYGMAAVLGLPARTLRDLVARARASGDLYLSNYNAPRQIVVAGAEPALDALCRLAVEAGARKAERLAVATLSHCPLLEPVADALAGAIAAMPVRPPRLLYASARRARVLTEAPAIAQDLARNVAEPVLWHDAVELLVERGMELFLQAPPGTVLADLLVEAHPDMRVRQAEALLR